MAIVKSTESCKIDAIAKNAELVNEIRRGYVLILHTLCT